MSNRPCRQDLRFIPWTAALVWIASSISAFGQCHGGMGGHNHTTASEVSITEHPEYQYRPVGGWPPLLERTPHGGLFLDTGTHLLEVVYLPRETRVYLYGPSMKPLSTLAIRGEMSPHGHNGESRQHIPLEQVASRDLDDQDHLAAAVDATRLPDNTPITFHFENLPDRRHSKAEFTPVFLQGQIRTYVMRVSFVSTDRERVVQQRTCPVTGAVLGSMGTPVKVLVGESPLYLCCTGCVDKVRDTARDGSAPPVVEARECEPRFVDGSQNRR